MASTEFYCNASTGANINAGSTTGAAPYTSTNGNWDATTGIFTPTSGNPSLTIAVGHFASVYNDGATTAVFIGRVTAVDATTVTVSLTAKSGTAPTTSATGRSLTAGGVWKGPNAAENFPFGFVQNTMTNASSHPPRVNLISGTNYAITAAMTHSNAGPVTFQGYTASVGDGGKATIDGTIVGASYVLLTASAGCLVEDLIFQNNGTTGSAAGVVATGNTVIFRRCVVNNVRGFGFSMGNSCLCMWCEAYACNGSNTASTGGFTANDRGGTRFHYCIAHDNAGSNTSGFELSQNSELVGCIADTNGAVGFRFTTNGACHRVSHCEAYNNVGDGLQHTNAGGSIALWHIENSNFVKNGTGGTGYGINLSGSARAGRIVNCGFGSGTQANTTGDTNGLSGVIVTGSITYASNTTPWVDPANGDFRINLATAQGTGYGTFTETASSYAGTVGYPDVGAAQHVDTPSTTVISRQTHVLVSP